MIRSFNVVSRCNSFSLSPLMSFLIGICVHLETISAIDSSVTTSESNACLEAEVVRVSISFSKVGIF